ncbi:MAG: hypothetical protein PVJ02_04765 [Gemmatimonadota bacterium]|jgi:hypothetical protein
MRFAYIDSQGNEVPIPSVDALALRIELGAIRPETQLYDAQADRWGPAHTHEIFLSLSRSAAEGGSGFVAPPPPAAPPPEPASPDAPPPSEPEKPDETEALGGGAKAAADEPEGPSAPAQEVDLDFTLTDVFATPGASEAPGDSEPGEGSGAREAPELPDALEPPAVSESPPPAAPEKPRDAAAAGAEDVDLDFTLAPEVPSEQDESPPAAAADPSAPASLDPGEGGALELEPPLSEQSVDAGGPDTPDATGAAHEVDDDAMELSLSPEAGAPDLSEAPELEAGDRAESPDDGAMDFSGSSVAGAMDLDLEPPLAEFTPDAPPAWMEQHGPSETDVEEDVMDFSRPSPAEPTPPVHPRASDEEPRPPRRPRPEPRSRPSPPRRPRKSPVGGILVGIVVVAVIGGGGYLGWQKLFAGGSGDGASATARPPVTLPEIPQELMPTMRDVGEKALGDVVARFRAKVAGMELPAEPRGDWLAGVYLANASQFPDIAAYWDGIGAVVDTVRADDTRVFHEAYAARLDSAGISGDRATLLLARADSGFLAAREGRFAAYALMDELVRSALDLHQFLLDNEDDIAYEPAAGGVSRDPVLEAVPNTPALGDRMWGMVDRITEALDALGTLDKVTTDRLTTVLLDDVRQAGFR